jgi:subtilisin family serine protease
MDRVDLESLRGSWEYCYGGRSRRLEVDPHYVAVRASPEAEQAIRSAASQRPHRPELGRRDHPGDLSMALRRAIDELPDHARSLLYPRERLSSINRSPERLARSYRRMRPQLEAEVPPGHLARIDELAAQLLSGGDTDPGTALRNAEAGSWLRLPTSLVSESAFLLRSSGALALPVLGSERLLSDQVFVRFSRRVEPDQMQSVLRRHDLTMVTKLYFAPGAAIANVVRREGDAFEHLRRLLEHPPTADFDLIEPVFFEPIFPRAGLPSPGGHHFQRQWQSPTTRLVDAWRKTQGNGIRIAVVDNGINIHHTDLAPGIVDGGWYELTSSGGVQFIPLTPGSASAFPQSNHGTFCCGMAAARGTSNGGVWGAAPGASIIPIACLRDQLGTQVTLARAIAYAADPASEQQSGNGADVISCSLGPRAPQWLISTALDLAIQFAASTGRNGRGCPVFWATSNATVDIIDDEVASHGNVLAVSRSNSADCYDGAAYGDRLAFVAPGRDVYSTTGSGGYDFDTGCSFATPLAAGIGALALDVDPSLTAQELGDKLKQTCDKVGSVPYNASGFHPELGYGRVNALNAVT